MFVKFIDGRRKGEIAEMKFADAQALIARGGAEKYPADPRKAPIAAPPSSPAAAQPKKKGKKR